MTTPHVGPTRRARTTPARRRALLAVAVPAALVAGLLAGCASSPSDGPATGTQTAAPWPSGVTPSATPTDQFTRDADGNVTGITYPGEDGETALDLLLGVDPSAKVQGEGKNAFVVGIGGRTADDAKHEFWSLEVDGTQAQVGAGSLKTKDGETITWTLATY
ncbi:hypothetical protein GCM10025864_34730 [Luteimicrobium album]|uniref:Transcobalamin-like C-terminal domain-containing protein n=1 Tax=Luteimicrobium album TaxID=1054550 RepID=A0ABQ6I7G3_9MICO|nr:DUF4430 domain-containing protein [Luteimicrobium album]GMA25714.1 hypothetical protein GCM10025864_34730 [Luteimicrobium album]